MKHLFFISFVAACLLASCTRPQLVFLNGEPIEGTPKEFIERSNYCGVDSANNPIYFDSETSNSDVRLGLNFRALF